jgi:hypothetical protein
MVGMVMVGMPLPCTELHSTAASTTKMTAFMLKDWSVEAGGYTRSRSHWVE